MQWLPYYLRPDTPAEGMPLPAHIRAYLARPDNPLKARFEVAGLKLVERDRIPNTRLAHEATEYARDQGRAQEFHHALMRRYWEAGEDVSNLEVLRAAAAEVGLDGAAMEQAVVAGAYRERVADMAAEARELGVTGIPTFIFGDRLAVVGAQEYAVLKQAVERLGLQPRTVAQA